MSIFCSLTQYGGASKTEPPIKKKRSTLKSLTEGVSPPPELLQNKSVNEQKLIRENWVSMQNYTHNCRVQSVHNIRLLNEPNNLTPQLDEIFLAQTRAFKINASVGVTLRHNTTGELRYFHASNNNNRLFPEPFLVQSRDEFKKFAQALENKNLSENVMNDKEDSEWVFHDVDNLSVYVNHLDFPITDNATQNQPKKSGVLDLGTDHNACFFYCLAAHKQPQKVQDYVS